jgi:hypothetical protein
MLLELTGVFNTTHYFFFVFANILQLQTYMKKGLLVKNTKSRTTNNHNMAQLDLSVPAKPTYKLKPNESVDELFARSNLIRTGPEFKKMLDFVTRFKNYRPYNNFLVYMQHPNCVYFATTKDWSKKFSRKPKEDARPLVILAPMHPVLFVYDIDDTEGKPMPELLDNPFEVKGEFNEENFHNVISYFGALNIKLHNKPLDFRHGGSIFRTTKASSPEIEINLKHTPVVNFATVVHELAHLFLGHVGSLANEKYPERDDQVMTSNALQEMEAESVSYLVLSRLSLQNKSAEYLAFYDAHPSDLKRVSMDLVLKTATKIEDMALAVYKAPKNPS